MEHQHNQQRDNSPQCTNPPNRRDPTPHTAHPTNSSRDSTPSAVHFVDVCLQPQCEGAPHASAARIIACEAAKATESHAHSQERRHSSNNDHEPDSSSRGYQVDRNQLQALGRQPSKDSLPARQHRKPRPSLPTLPACVPRHDVEPCDSHVGPGAISFVSR